MQFRVNDRVMFSQLEFDLGFQKFDSLFGQSGTVTQANLRNKEDRYEVKFDNGEKHVVDGSSLELLTDVYGSTESVQT